MMSTVSFTESPGSPGRSIVSEKSMKNRSNLMLPDWRALRTLNLKVDYKKHFLYRQGTEPGAAVGNREEKAGSFPQGAHNLVEERHRY